MTTPDPSAEMTAHRETSAAKAGQLWALAQAADANGKVTTVIESDPTPAAAPIDGVPADADTTAPQIDHAQGGMPDAVVLGGDPVALAEAEGDFLKARALKADALRSLHHQQ